jgi:predicted RecB family nuclease
MISSRERGHITARRALEAFAVRNEYKLTLKELGEYLGGITPETARQCYERGHGIVKRCHRNKRIFNYARYEKDVRTKVR